MESLSKHYCYYDRAEEVYGNMANFSVNGEDELLHSRYCLDAMIAGGNYSRIFLARDLTSDNLKCVVKQLLPHFYSVDAKHTIESMFRQEAQILQKLVGKHPQICQFYDYFTDSGCLYLVLEWIEGITLEQKLRLTKPPQGKRSLAKMSESETRNILLNLLPVLDCIHRLGIIHRDLQPNNIILRARDNLPVLIDFSIAKEFKEFERSKLTMEQAVADSDLYSLGLMAIHLLTGRSPQAADFNLDSPGNFWHREKTAFDDNLVRVIDRAIAFYPSRRFTSAKEMRAALQAQKRTLSSTQTKTKQLATSSPYSSYFSADKRSPNVKSQQELWTLCLIFSAEILILWLAIRYLVSIPDYQPPLDFSDLPQTDYYIPIPTYYGAESTVFETTNNALKAIIFSPGTSENTIFQALGEPKSRLPGFWTNTIAWSYEDMLMPEIDLGYIFDRNTDRLRQAEIAVPPTTDFSTIKSALKALLAETILTDTIESGLQAVYQRQKSTFDFTLGNLEGTIQRNYQDRIYIGIWQADFH